MEKELASREDQVARIAQSLSGLGSAGQVSVMPDYFVDRFVRINTIDEFVAAIRKKSLEGGGGSIRGVKQIEVKGGNAVNLAYSLGKFGTRVHLVAIADSLPANMLLATFAHLKNVKTDVVKGKAGFTIALEFVEGKRHVNVMASDVGDLAEFDGSMIESSSWKSMESARIVCVVNWAANKHANTLCERVFSFAKENGAETFLDPADISGMEENIRKLKKEVFDKGLLDKMSINENEARVLGNALCGIVLPHEYSEADLRKVARAISDSSNSMVDLHTGARSITCLGNDCTVVPSHNVTQKTVTGAGDVWDAADVVGHLLGWDPVLRLMFANAAAGLFVSRENPEPPCLEEVLEFLEINDSNY